MRQVSKKSVKLNGKRKIMLCAMVSSALMLGMTGHSSAEEQQEYAFEQVVVTATKTPVKEFEANANITVITREEIERNHYQDISDALKTVPGVTISNYSIAGYEQSNTLKINGTEKIVVLIDGVRANVNGSTFSVFPASGFTSMDQVERIEILKGSASTLYGADAKGGVINIITRKAAGNKTTLTLSGGNFSKENYSLMHRGQSDDYSWIIQSQKYKSGNFTAGNGVEVPAFSDMNNHSLKLSKKINNASDITVNYDKYDYDVKYGGTYNNQTGVQDTAVKLADGDAYNLSVTYDHQFSDTAKNQLVVFNRRRDMRSDIGQPGLWLMKLQTRGIQDQLTWNAADRHTVVSGFDFYEDRILDYIDQNSSYQNKEVTNRAVYVQDEWSLSEQWKLTSGLRYDKHSTHGSNLSPAVNLGYKPSDKTSYYVAYKEFFVAPNQYQLFSPYAPADPSTLKPETGHTLEAGINHRLDGTTAATFHIFTRDTEDKIYYDANNGYKVGNIDKEKARGWDLQLDKKLSKALSLFVSYASLHVDPNTETKLKNQNGSLPKGTWNVGVNYQQDKYDIGLQGRGIVDKPGSRANAFPENSYWVWDMAANYTITKDTKAFLKVNNVFDKLYAEMSNNSNVWYLSPGRNYQAGIQYTF